LTNRETVPKIPEKTMKRLQRRNGHGKMYRMGTLGDVGTRTGMQ